MRTANRPSRSFRPHQSGSAVVIVLALLALALAYATFNARTLHHLDRDVDLLEHRQLLRLQTAGLLTNAPPALLRSLTNSHRAAALDR